MCHGAAHPLPHLESLTAILTGECNLRCAYCYQDRKKGSPINWDILKAGIDLLLAAPAALAQLCFSGGEPLLEPTLLRRAVEYCESHRPQSKRLHLVVATNGTLVNDDTLDYFAGHGIELRLSFDGIEEAQRWRGGGTFALLDDLLQRARRLHPAFANRFLRVGITLHSKNVSFLASSFEYLVESGVRDVFVAPLVTHDAGWRAASTEELERQFARIFAFSITHRERWGRVPLVLFRKRATEATECSPGLGLCGVARGSSLALGPDGTLYLCTLFVESYQRLDTAFLRERLRPLVLGHVRQADLAHSLDRVREAVGRARIFDDRARKYSDIEACSRCRYAAQCTVCPVAIGHVPQAHDPDFIPAASCVFNRVALEFRERFPAMDVPLAFLRSTTRLPGAMSAIRAAARRAKSEGDDR